MRQDVVIAGRAAAFALGALALYACSTPNDQAAGQTSVAPAVTGQNSSASGVPTLDKDQPPPPPTDVTEQKTGPK